MVWDPAKKHNDMERWICIYPVYINSKKSLAEGRKMPLSKCVENPTAQEIRDILVSVRMNVGVENKLHPKERSKELLYRGRIRVQLRMEDGTPFNPDYPTRHSLLEYLGTSIPKLKTRQGKPSGGDQQQQQQSSSGGSKKGKGKGRR